MISRLSLIFFIAIFSDYSIGQIVELSPSLPVKPKVKIQSEQISANNSLVVPVSTEVVSYSLEKFHKDLFQKIQMGDSFDGLIQEFGFLTCKDTHKDQSLSLSCFECELSKNPKVVFEFSQRDLGVGSCELSKAILSSSATDDSLIKKSKENFKESLKTYRTAAARELDDKLIYENETERIEWRLNKSFDLKKNTFVEFAETSISYLEFLETQREIENAKLIMNSSVQDLSTQWKYDFSKELFYDEPGETSNDLMDELFLVLFPKEQSEENKSMLASSQVATENFESEKQRKFLQAWHYLSGAKEKNQVCYAELLKRHLPVKLQDWKGESTFLSIKAIEEDGKNYSLISFSGKKTKEQVGVCSSLIKLHQLELGWSAQKCEDHLRYLASFEEVYKNFYEGKPNTKNPKFRSLLVFRMLQLSEQIYFENLADLEKVKAGSDTIETINTAYKLKSEAIESSLAKIDDYLKELEELLPGLKSALLLRRTWLLKGISSKEVFTQCQN